MRLHHAEGKIWALYTGSIGSRSRSVGKCKIDESGDNDVK
ncbi:unnamed protein product [Urochloa humidicola]